MAGIDIQVGVMGSIHDQAMQYIYQQVLQRVLEHLSQAQKASLQLLVQRLIVAAGGLERTKGLRLMFVFDASLRCAQALACVRAAQLSIAARAPHTFHLRIATAWQAGMSTTAQANIDSTFSRLFMHDDPRVELLVLDADELLSYDNRRAPSDAQQLAERQEWLLCGHLGGGSPLLANFASHGYLHLAELARQAITWQGRVDAVINADSLADRKRYLAWSRRSLRNAELLGARPIHSCAAALLEGMGELHRRYLDLLQGHESAFVPAGAEPEFGEQPALRFITIDDLVADHETLHAKRLSRFLGYNFDQQADPGGHSGIANPLLLAHLQGLKAEFIDNTQYGDGIHLYLQQTRQRMQRNDDFATVETCIFDYWQTGELEQRRGEANDFASQAYGLSEAQLVCQLFSPFVGRGAQLETFLCRCHPGMLVAMPYLHKALQGQSAPEPVVQWLVDTSGLPLPMLQKLYSRDALAGGSQCLLSRLRVRGANLRHLKYRAANSVLSDGEQAGIC
ncbi:hypothetical protein [Pseudomonas auratipiscis]|uniref:Uncharacterized protein n=1 Tax=Pseudomonas auratipiscis TaxID=3115853 RepID=A0AB35WRN4_9PSED|nr:MULTISPECIES: hypothetical protein [unclassified Pseudomonas]MEE1865884.1 hypothetical protein [Pseudomonas sp. 120P]MEE1956947.1 hypothetical protein [Pseudomonas sp. 119P]